MYDAYEYTSVNGIALKSTYKAYSASVSKQCTYDPSMLHFKNVDMVEVDGANNDELK